MPIVFKKKKSRKRNVVGYGLLNNLIDKLPLELLLPGYEFCGPGTKLQKRLARGDKGINPLDAACREHDIAYSKHSDIENRYIADNILAERAWERVKAKDTSIGERANAWLVTNVMKTKTKMGGRLFKIKKPKKKTKKCCTNTFTTAVKAATKILKKRNRQILSPYKSRINRFHQL